MQLNRRQLKAADRFTGAVYVLPWPDGLRHPAAGPFLVAAHPEEHRAAVSAIGDQLAVAGINIIDVEVAWPTKRPQNVPEGPCLFVYAIHKRWPQNLDCSKAGDHARWTWVCRSTTYRRN